MLRLVQRSPTLRFVLLGTLLFAIDRARSSAAVDTEDRLQIVVDDQVVARLDTTLRMRMGRAPSAAEREVAIAAWTDEEMLYREGLALGIDRGDEEIRLRIVTRSRYFHAADDAPPPSDEEIRAYYAARAESFSRPARFDFEHVFIRGENDQVRARITDATRRVSAGEPMASLGDPHPSGPRVLNHAPDAIRRQFGEGFALALASMRPSDVRMLRSKDGSHVVRLLRIAPPSRIPIEEAREGILEAIRGERADRRIREVLARLRQTYRVESTFRRGPR